jgi:hypothetical protein
MNAPAKETPPVVIVVPPTLVVLIGELSERMARVTGETPEDTRRAVELSILSRGVAAVQNEIVAGENQAERNGWPR